MDKGVIMKKQIGFYIGWDVILFIIINLNSLYEFKLKEMNLRMQVSTGALGWCYVALLLLIGFWFFVLIFFNRKTEMTRKRAICELVCIGVPSLYLATYRAIIFSLLQIYHNLSVLYPYSLTKILGRFLFITAFV